MLQKFIFNIPVNSDVIFSNHKNRYKKRIEKRQRSLIVKISFIKPFLDDDENVLRITRGYSSFKIFDLLLMGWLFIWLKRSLFVFTDKRIFHIPTDMSYSYRNSIVQTLYSGCKSIKLKLGTLVVECPVCDHKDKYIGISLKDRKKIREILKTVNLGGNTIEDSGRVSLCPSCTKKLEKGKYICENCNVVFKNKDKARILSIFLPGGGYFYSRHIFLGVMNALLEIFLLAGICFSSYTMISDYENRPLFLAGFSLAFLLGKVISVYHSNRFIDEFIPTTKKVSILSSLK